MPQTDDDLHIREQGEPERERETETGVLPTPGLLHAKTFDQLQCSIAQVIQFGSLLPARLDLRWQKIPTPTQPFQDEIINLNDIKILPITGGVVRMGGMIRSSGPR